MPYIGQRPATGEANSFKILDEISSFTMTFDGSNAAVVSVANDTITAREHRFVTGQRVTYNDGGGTAITGLSDGVYYIIVEDRHTFKLASSANNAASGTAINLEGLGVGASHTLNVAFDGVNTKFKATINNGDRAGITASGQLMLSINGVLQEPHDNTTSPTTGYSTDPTSTIIFSAAPVATDQFFGRLIASNFATFDISDNVVDNFTGDGSTTTFTLSKSATNNQNLLVTIDGVVQYPDDKDAIRAYSVSENILTFASAPGNDVEIQVRHIGFAGATSGGSGGVSGFYGRTGNAVLKSTDDIVFNDATASGDIQAANVTVTGDLTVNGTTTTLDTELTSVDKLEVAANNTTVAAAITQTGTGDIFNLYDGSTEVFSVTDGGKILVGTQTEGNANADNLTIADANNTGITIRSGTSNIGSIFFSDATSGGGEYAGFIDYNHSSNQMSLGTAENTRVTITSAGKVGIGTVNPAAELEVYGNGRFKDADGSHGIELYPDVAGLGYQRIISYNRTSSAYENLSIGVNDFIVTTGSTSERFRVTSGGNIGINTNNPADKLSIYSAPNTLIFGAKDTTRGNHVFQLLADDSAGNGELRLYQNSASGTHAKTVEIASSGNSYITGGDFGVGTASPTARFDVRRGDADGKIAEFHQSTGYGIDIGSSQADAYISSGYNQSFIFKTDPSSGQVERLRITKNGSVGIGTDNPQEKLHVNGTSDFIVDTDAAGLRFGSYGEHDIALVTGRNTPSGSSRLYIENGNGEALRITSDGNMGLGATNPGADPAIGNAATVFEIRQTTTGNISSGNDRKGAVLRLKHEAQWENGYQNSATDDLGRVEFVTGDSSTGEGVRAAIRCRNLQYYNNHALTFEVANSNSATLLERLRITSAGALLVGLTEAVGEGGTPADLNSTEVGRGYINLSRDDTAAADHILFGKNGSVAASVGTDTTNTLVFKTGTTERLRINSNGTTQFTPEGSTSNPYLLIDTSGDNARFNAAKSSGNCGLIFVTQNSGTATERLRITDEGKFGFKTSSPNYTVDINGEVGITEGQPITWHDGSGSLSAQIFAQSDDSLVFRNTSSGSERMRITSGGNVAIKNDSGKFTAGASDDLLLYHDGSQSYIAGDDIRITNKAVSETQAKFLANGTVELYHNNSKKIETTSTGVTVTGTVTADGFSGSLTSDNTAKAWVNFNGTGSVSIRDDFNVNTVSDQGTGKYFVNFSSSLSNGNYAAALGISGANGYVMSNSLKDGYGRGGTMSSSGFNIWTNNDSNHSGDESVVTAVVFD